MSEIGAEAGVTGAAIYRHFDSKSAVLVALFDQVIDRLLAQAQEIARADADPADALSRLIAGQVEFVVAERELAQVYYHEIHNLPEADRRRLRRKQRLYLEEWVHLLTELREDLPDTEARGVVHAAIGAIQSALFHNSGLPDDRLRRLLAASAEAVLRSSPREGIQPGHGQPLRSLTLPAGLPEGATAADGIAVAGDNAKGSAAPLVFPDGRQVSMVSAVAETREVLGKECTATSQ
jgi:AcrR family transcriptional regulator